MYIVASLQTDSSIIVRYLYYRKIAVAQTYSFITSI